MSKAVRDFIIFRNVLNY